MKARSWFRLTVAADGRVVDCRPVGDEGTAELGVFYVLAESAQDAAKQALNAQAARLLQARRERYDAEGRCRCGGKRDRPEFKTCARCATRRDLHFERKAAKLRGETVEKPDRRTVLQERKRSEADDLRLEVLREVQQAWFNNRTVGAFSKWLNGEVEKLEGQKQRVA